MKKLIILLIMVLAFFAAESKYRQTCIAQYKTGYGWSKRYTFEVTFMTGYELNLATGSSRYKLLTVYAIIFWGDGQASVISVSNFNTCYLETDRLCITSIFGDIKGFDQDGDEWKICKDEFCF